MSSINIYTEAYCVVAVGSTQFNELIHALDNPAFYQLLKDANYSAVLFQIGTGTYRPSQNCSFLKVEIHDFIVLEDYIKHANLVICHCGAGILLESLRAVTNPHIIAVVNTSLMENHQAELAEQLEADGLVYKADPASVLTNLEQILREGKRLKKYQERTEGLLLDVIDDLMM